MKCGITAKPRGKFGIMDIDIFDKFYDGKKVLVTGHTGFKGSWLSIWLQELGADVIGLSLDPYSSRDNYVLSGIKDKILDLRGDIRDAELLRQTVEEQRPDIIFHLAAQPLVRLSYSAPAETYSTNVMGSIHVMEAFRKSENTRVCIMVTTDKCYANREQLWGYRETDRMGGHDPYSSSKGAVELAVSSWRSSYFNPQEYEKHGKSIASVRAGNVIGGGDWSLDRIVPDCIRSLESNNPVSIRSPRSVRPWQHVLEPLSGYLLLAEKMWNNPVDYSEGWNFGPEIETSASVWDVARMITESYGRGYLTDQSGGEALHEASLLLLDITKARFRLGWEPRFNLSQTIDMTVDWYKRYRSESVYDICTEQICEFICV